MSAVNNDPSLMHIWIGFHYDQMGTLKYRWADGQVYQNLSQWLPNTFKLVRLYSLFEFENLKTRKKRIYFG